MTAAQHLRIATRKSPLALQQAEFIKTRLLQHYPQLKIDLVPMTTEGDIRLDTPLATIGGKGLFVKELEKALLENRADIAVHSMKDVPVYFPDGLMLNTICKRDDARDVFVANHYKNLADLPLGATIGTSSLRRQCQLKAYRSDLNIINLRGNVQTRLKKLDQDEFDAIILAAAGLDRLNLSERISSYIPLEIMLPAVGQGALGIETRVADPEIQTLLAPLHDATTAYCVLAERAFNRFLEGGCQVPIAGFAILNNTKLFLRGLVGSLDGLQQIRGEIKGPATQAELLGKILAEDLLNRGAKDILDQIYKT